MKRINNYKNARENSLNIVTKSSISPADTKSANHTFLYLSNKSVRLYSRGTKVEKMLTLAPERYTAGFRMVAKVILWCI